MHAMNQGLTLALATMKTAFTLHASAPFASPVGTLKLAIVFLPVDHNLQAKIGFLGTCMPSIRLRYCVYPLFCATLVY